VTFDYRTYYKAIYEANPEYGSFDHSRDARAEIVLQKHKSLIDIGCGNGEFLQYMRRFSPETELYGLDVAGQVYDGTLLFQQSATDRWPIDEIEAITCFDFLEHLAPEDVDFVLGEMKRIGKVVYAKISHSPSKALAPDGSDPHLTVEDGKWWFKKFKSFGFLPVGAIYKEKDHVKSDIVWIFKSTQDEPGHANKRGV